MMENQQDRLNSLKKSWEITKRHFDAARALLPLPLIQYPESESGSLKSFEEYLAQNELELALYDLEGLGNANNCGGEFWQELTAAAENMKLTTQANRFREKAGQE